MTDESALVPAIKVSQNQRSFLLLRLRAEDLVRVSYVAARGVSKDKNAVQRLLSRPRISGISDFAKSGGDFPSCIVLNWVNSSQKIKFAKGHASIPLASQSAQILDGQHRVEGLREAMKTDAAVKNVEIPVAVYMGLANRECADIFLSINTEQKPAPRSLVFDLYDVASNYVRDDDALAAKKVADALNERDDSPYKSLIRYPGPAASLKGIALSSVVGVLKPLLAQNGAFDQVDIPAEMAEERTQIVVNWVKVLQHAYGAQWKDKGNVFLYASGFWGAMKFLESTMLKHCHLKDSFTQDTMQSAMKGLRSQLFWQTDVKGMQGRRSADVIANHLDNVFAVNKKPRSKLNV